MVVTLPLDHVPVLRQLPLHVEVRAVRLAHQHLITPRRARRRKSIARSSSIRLKSRRSLLLRIVARDMRVFVVCRRRAFRHGLRTARSSSRVHKLSDSVAFTGSLSGPIGASDSLAHSPSTLMYRTITAPFFALTSHLRWRTQIWGRVSDPA